MSLAQKLNRMIDDKDKDDPKHQLKIVDEDNESVNSEDTRNIDAMI